MKVKSDLSAVQAALLRAADTHPVDNEVKLAREIAATDFLEKVGGTKQTTFDPLKTARRLWDGKDESTITSTAAHLLSDASHAEVQSFLKNANPEDFESMIDAFANRLLEDDAPAEALSAVLDFKAMCGASARSAREYNSRLRSTPSYMRAGATPIDKKTLAGLETLHDALENRVNNPEWEPAVVLTAALTEIVGDFSSVLPEGAFEGLGEVADTGRAVIFGGIGLAKRAFGIGKDKKAEAEDGDQADLKSSPGWLKKRASELRDYVIPKGVQDKSKALVSNATELLDRMSEAEAQAEDAGRLGRHVCPRTGAPRLWR